MHLHRQAGRQAGSRAKAGWRQCWQAGGKEVRAELADRASGTPAGNRAYMQVRPQVHVHAFSQIGRQAVRHRQERHTDIEQVFFARATGTLINILLRVSNHRLDRV